ncbi:WD40/YVTN/BNR-like repeat-containing protein [Halomarina salina]|uniref:WD40/YVTN/BNR-like repeat-containing protein n=1 Tax=Halomarina salina TaxID=1872699 RepID=A0ABD5RNZ6_9EURY|nr:twin-arginine translocation signal domain-containing protein [Halomarina salina]
MNESSTSRRGFLKVTGATAAAVVGVPTVAAQDSSNGWTEAESPTTKTLNDAVDTVEGPVAVGGGGDVVIRRQDGWERIVNYGPQARSRPLTGCDVTDDGKAVWFVGGSGVIGEYRVDTQTLTNYSAPKGKTSTWEDCAVVGTAGTDERLYFVNGSGELLVGVRQESGAVKYDDVVKPGGGSTIPGIDFHARQKGRVASTSQLVAETTDGGTNWEQIGIDFAGNAFYDIASVGAKDVNVAAGGGIVYRYDGFRWTPHVVDDDRQAIRALDRGTDYGYAAGNGGKVYERLSAGQWKLYETPVSTKFQGVAHGDTYDVAVGNGGTIVERDSSTDTSTDSLSSESLGVREYVEGAVTG